MPRFVWNDKAALEYIILQYVLQYKSTSSGFFNAVLSMRNVRFGINNGILAVGKCAEQNDKLTPQL